MRKLFIFLGIVCVPVSALLSDEPTFSEQQASFRENGYFSSLPPGFLSFEEFEKEFRLGEVSTEQIHPLTRTLSQTMHKKIEDGLSLLLDVDEKVIEGLEAFTDSIESLVPSLLESIKRGGRVFLVGSGSSGRVAIDLAAKCRRVFTEFQEQVVGVIAGGDSAFIRAKEGFEDSEADGMVALKDKHIDHQDVVILISASGSASFNVGCGHFVADQGAKVFYFYNSIRIPFKTQRLFERIDNPIIPLCVDIGPQAIAGSTRLQGATLAEACLGALLGATFYSIQSKEGLAKDYPYLLAKNMHKGIALLRNQLGLIAECIEMEKKVFSDSLANFRKLKDLTDKGYVTFIACEDSMREVLIDATEMSPTFSINPIHKKGEEYKKRAEFRAYLLGKKENQEAWRSLLGREIQKEDASDAEAFILACETEGHYSYQNRPKGMGNLVIGVAKLRDKQIPFEIMQGLEEVRKEGGEVALVLMCSEALNEQQAKQLSQFDGISLVFENVPYDELGLTETIVLKQGLNLISNGAMVLMNKVHGNQMIDVRASNHKLIDRCMRLIKQIWSQNQPHIVLSDKNLYNDILHIVAIKNGYEEKGKYTPSVIKIILAMYALKKNLDDFQEIIDFLIGKEERIDWITE